jgi:DNA repair protein RadC
MRPVSSVFPIARVSLTSATNAAESLYRRGIDNRERSRIPYSGVRWTGWFNAENVLVKIVLMSRESYPQTIKSWPEDERPRERLIKFGAETLSDAQVLAIILGTGDASAGTTALDLARTLLTRFGDFQGLDSAGVNEICSVKGIGRAKATQIKAALEMGKRNLSQQGQTGRKFNSSREVADYYHPMLAGTKKEIFKAVLLDGKNRVLKDVTISEGSLNASVVHPREVFNPAIKESAAAVIFVHNHPSGDPSPSSEDRAVTERLVKTGEVVGIRVLDHVVLGRGEYFSFMDEKLL